MKLLKEDLETKKSYTVAVTYAATINVIVDANSEEEAIQLAQSGTGISSSWDNEYFTVECDYEIDSLDYGDTPIIESTILNVEEINDEDDDYDEDDEDYLVENELANKEKLKMSDIMVASMPQDENVNFYLSDEHTSFGYGDFYAYLIINHPKLGQFIVSVSADGTNVRTDGRPWDFLQRPRHKLSNEQIEYVESIKDNLKFIKLIESDTPRFTNKDFEDSSKYIDIGKIDRDKRVDVILSDDKIRPRASSKDRGFDTRLAYNFKNPYPAGRESLPIKVLKILKENGALSKRQINEILGKPATYYSNLFREMIYVGLINRDKSAAKYVITDAGLKYLNNAKRKA